jgi:hypothetical protein
VDARDHPDEHPMNLLAVSTSRLAEWRWRIVDLQGATLEESSAKFPTIGAALAAGTEQLQVLRERDRPLPAQVPWHRRR